MSSIVRPRLDVMGTMPSVSEQDGDHLKSVAETRRRARAEPRASGILLLVNE